MNRSEDVVPGIILLTPVTVVFFGLWYWRYVRMGIFRSMLLALMAELFGIACFFATKGQVLAKSPWLDRSPWVNHAPWVANRWEDLALPALAYMLTVLLAAGLVTKVYRAGILQKASDDEKAGDGDGVRAWLRPGNVISVLGIVTGAYFGMGWSPWGTAASVLAVLLAYPLLNCLLQHETATKSKLSQESAEERMRVLALVESGKITGEDGADLIGALGHSRAAAAEESSLGMAGNRRIMLIGAVMVVMGFFLPWISVNMGQAIQEAAGELRQHATPVMPVGPQGTDMNGQSTVEITPGMRITVSGQAWPENLPIPLNNGLSVRGGEVEYGLGWLVMLTGVAVAVLPLLWPPRTANRQAQRGISLVMLGAGTLVIAYLVVNKVLVHSSVHLEVGLVLVLAGYLTLWIGALREYVLHAKAPSPVAVMG